MSAPRYVVVDFDGTLCDHAFPDVGKVKPGAKEALTAIRKAGYGIIISSCRTSRWFDEFFPEGTLAPLERKSFADMVTFLAENEIPYDVIDDGSKGKPLGDLYIDDRGLRFQDNWDQIGAMFKGVGENG
jgi:hydroxymethylpyrimidine pyrophosphatase-like HAD family hydrolase